MSISALLFYVLTVIVNILLESVVLIRVNLFGIRPDSIVMVVVVIGIVVGSNKAALYGLICGLIIDSMFGDFIGLYGLCYLLIGGISGYFSDKYYAQNYAFAAILATLAHLFKELVIGITFSILKLEFTIGSAFFRYMLPSALLTGVFCIPVFILYYKRKQKQIRRARFAK